MSLTSSWSQASSTTAASSSTVKRLVSVCTQSFLAHAKQVQWDLDPGNLESDKEVEYCDRQTIVMSSCWYGTICYPASGESEITR